MVSVNNVKNACVGDSVVGDSVVGVVVVYVVVGCDNVIKSSAISMTASQLSNMTACPIISWIKLTGSGFCVVLNTFNQVVNIVLWCDSIL